MDKHKIYCVVIHLNLKHKETKLLLLFHSIGYILIVVILLQLHPLQLFQYVK